MNILHLKYAIEVSKAGSINKAAENLLIGQPNLSRAIRELETSFGITIFDRSSKGMVVTAEGAKFLTHAKSIIKQIDDVEKIYKKEKDEKIRFSISVPRASYVSEAFSKFSCKYKKEFVEMYYRETNSFTAIENIINADYKLGIIRYAETHDSYFKPLLNENGLEYETIGKFVHNLLMSEKSPIANKDVITHADLKDLTEVAHSDPFVPYMSAWNLKKEELPSYSNKQIYVFERASQFEILSDNEQTFMWVSKVPEKLLKAYNLVQKECSDHTKVYKDVLIYPKGYQLTKIDKDFIETLKGSKPNYLQKKSSFNRDILKNNRF